MIRRRDLESRIAGLIRRTGAEPLAGGLDVLVAQLEGQVDEALRRSSEQAARDERLAAALGMVAEGVVVVDRQGEVVLRNAAAEAYSGGRHGDALAERAIAALLGRAVAGEVASQVLDLWGPPRRSLLVSALPLVGERSSLGAMAVVQDVSERRRLDAVRRDFVANVSHELKTPVGAIAILSEALAEEDDPEVVRRLAGRVQGEAERLGRIIEDLLDLSRLESDEAQQRELVAVGQAVEEAVALVRTAADHRGVALRADVEHDLLVLADRRQLVSAVHNLLRNAVTYSDEGSEVLVSARLQGEAAAIAVVDHGVGIPARDLERVFERFYRVDRARARDTGGTGLGLAIVRHVAQLHGGSVDVRSLEGEGSTFTLRIPAAVPAEAPAPGGAVPLTRPA